MANQLLVTQQITRRTLIALSNNTIVIPKTYRDLDDEFGRAGAKIGGTIMQRKPSRFTVRNGAAFSAQPLVDTAVPISITQQIGVDWTIGSEELKLSIDDMDERYLTKRGLAMANEMDLRMLAMMEQNTANLVGTVGVTPGRSGSNAYDIYAQAGQKLGEMGFPLKGRTRTLIINEAMRTGWVQNQTGLFNPQSQIGMQFKTGMVSDQIDYEIFVDQNVATQVLGTFGGTPAVSGAGQTGNTLNVSGLTASVATWANVGDNFTIANVFAVNPQSRLSTGALQDFVVQATVTSDSSGLATITFAPAIVPSGQFQNVDSSPADAALINIYHTAAAGQSALSGISAPQGILFDKEAFAFVSMKAPIPNGTNEAYSEMDPDTGVAIRSISDFITGSDQFVYRCDSYFGNGPMYIEGSVRITN